MKATLIRRTAFTLLEVLLALALASLVFVAIAMAVDLQLRVIDAGRTETEEAQLARAILRRMADDLRGAVQYQVIDFSSLESLASNAAGVAGNLQSEDDLVGTDLDPNADSGGNPTGGGGSTGGASGGGGSGDTTGGLDETGSDADSEISPSQDIAATGAPATIPGVYGNQYELQIDVSRLPRPDEYSGVMAMTDGTSPLIIPSDVKTVSYFLRTAGDAALTPMTQGGFTDEATQGGLVRREIDRAVARYAMDSGDITLLDATGDVIAPEVTNLQFQYFDGVSWLQEWDSELMEGLPVAIEIAIAITPRRFLEDAEEGSLGGSASEFFPGEMVYRTVVRLPAAKVAASSTSSEMEDLGL